MFSRKTQRIDLTGGTLAAVQHITQALEIMMGETPEFNRCALVLRKNESSATNSLSKTLLREVEIKGAGKFYPSNQCFRFEAALSMRKTIKTGLERWEVCGCADIMFSLEDNPCKPLTEYCIARWDYSDDTRPQVRIFSVSASWNMWRVGRSLADRHEKPLNPMATTT